MRGIISAITFVLGIALVLISASRSTGTGTDKEFGFTKGDPAVIKLSPRLLKYESFTLNQQIDIYGVDITTSATGKISVAYKEDWESEGWPMMSAFRFEKAHEKKDFIELEFRSPERYIKLRFSTSIRDLTRAINSIVFRGNGASYLSSTDYKNTCDKLLLAMFAGPLENIPKDSKMTILESTGYEGKFGFEQFKGADYLAIDLGVIPVIYNSITNPPELRQGRVLSRNVLPVLSKLSRLEANFAGNGGIKVGLTILYKDFDQERNLKYPHSETLIIYCPFVLVKQYGEADITGSDLTIRSIILVNGIKKSMIPVDY
jgi:hypothetical protein